MSNAPLGPDDIRNAMTVDVEEYFQVSAFANQVDPEAWTTLPSRVVESVERILATFDEFGVRATFFVLGWIAEQHPSLVRRIANEGHEVASHGYAHVRVTDQEPEQFRADVLRTKSILEDTTGIPVRGYRAASFSINASNLWAHEVLAETGHEYSSSIYPGNHDHYGMPGASRFAFCPNENGVLEIPVTTVVSGGRRLPAGGGGYFRLLPYRYFSWAVSRVNGSDQRAAIFYFHPWEIDPEQPRMQNLPLKTRFRHYVNLSRFESRLRRLLGDFRWGPSCEVFELESARHAELSNP
ncbi:MAG: XrtA system polysaccharide deacetylase [Pseudomonadota bacterium]